MLILICIFLLAPGAAAIGIGRLLVRNKGLHATPEILFAVAGSICGAVISSWNVSSMGSGADPSLTGIHYAAWSFGLSLIACIVWRISRK